MGYSPKEIAQIAVQKGVEKANMPLTNMLILGFLGGAFISIGYLAYIRVTGTLPEEWGSFASFLGANVFPIGLILILLAGGELVTGNMMAVAMAYFAKRIKLAKLIRNWFWVTLFNFAGAVFVAYCFGHIAGLAEGDFLNKTVSTAYGKVNASFLEAFVSAIGCNWLVALAVWLCYGTTSFSGKILSIWFPIMTFVLIGFQHVVANMFIIPAAIFAGELTWVQYFSNFVPVFFGNAVGGAIFVSLFYYFAFLKNQ